MDERDFFKSVAERTGLSREEATDLTWATLKAIAERLSPGSVRDLALHLPDGLAEEVRGVRGKPSRRRGLTDAEEQVSAHTGLRPDEVHDGIAAVLATMHDAMSAPAFDHVLAQLPGQFRDLAAEDSR